MPPPPPPGPLGTKEGGSQPAQSGELLSLLKSIQTDLHSLLGKVEGPVKALVEKVNKGVNKAIPLAQPVSLAEINSKLDKISKSLSSPTSLPTNRVSYAQIAAQNLGSPLVSPLTLPLTNQPSTHPPPPMRHFSAILRVAEQSPLRQNGASASSILMEVKKEFAGVIATTPLPSGQIRVSFASQREKEGALAKGTSKGLQGAFQRELFPVEVLSVPTSTQVECEKGAKNEALISELEQANSRLLKDPKIQKVAWIKGKRSLLPKEKDSPPPDLLPLSSTLLVRRPRKQLL